MPLVAVSLVFLLGIANFAVHRAAIEGGRGVLQRMPLLSDPRARQLALGLEFAVLLAALLLVANGQPEVAWGYLVYTAANGLSAWLLLTGRV